jgi:hypothetical protein
MSTVTGQQEKEESDFVLVPRQPTKEMLEAAWADALGEDARGVWQSMINAYYKSIGNSDSCNG